MNALFYDEKCKLCINTIFFLKKYVIPKNVKYFAVGKSHLSIDDKKAALKDMLLISESGAKYWGYKTYIKLFSLSNSKYSILFVILSRLMLLPFISKLGKEIYKFVSKKRKRCEDGCSF